MKIKDVIHALEKFAPLPLQESYDNAGLQVGLTETESSGALLCLDVTEEVIEEAIELGCNIIVAHHPLIFKKLSCITDTTLVQRCVIKALQNNITIVAMHTNIDSAVNGVNFKIAEKLNMHDLQFFGGIKDIDGVAGGSGVIGQLAQPLNANEFISLLKSTFDVACVQCNELLKRPISKVALCGGAGSFLLNDAIKAGADAFITGEMHYHDYFDTEQKIQIAVLGHYQSEQFTTEIFKSIIENNYPGLPCFITKVNTNPIIYI